MYQVIDEFRVLRIADQAIIPVSMENMDYVRYLEWLAEGDTPEPMGHDVPPAGDS